MATRIQAVWRRHSAKRVVQAFRLQASSQNQASAATIIQAIPESSSSPSSDCLSAESQEQAHKLIYVT